LTGATQFSVSGNGSLVYVLADPARAPQRTLVWVSRSGAEQPLAAPAREYDIPRLSPDGRRVVMKVGDNVAAQLWVYDLARDTLTRFTFEASDNSDPVWTPDGSRIAFQSNKDGAPMLFWQLADGGGAAERLTSGGERGPNPQSWSADGQLLAFHDYRPATQRDISVLQLRDREIVPFLRTPFTEGAPQFSRNGRWLAYVSNESGRPEIYVQPYPGPGGKWQISTEGGTEPVWSRNGRELFYRNANRMMTVDVTTGPGFSAAKPRMLFEGEYFANTFPETGVAYDVSLDGQRFLMVKENAASRSAAQINVVLNWQEELKQRVPTR
jgi:dipeptidyl aminopeptidase/acylaminoacyl peptidase